MNNNHYDTYVNNNNYGRGYNPSRTETTDRRSGYTVVNGRSTQGAGAGTGTSGTGRTQGSTVDTGTSGTGRTQGTRTGTGTGTTGSRSNSTGQNAGDKGKSNNGLRMGQNRRGVAVPTEAKPNEPVRTNNPNVNDRTDPGREKVRTGTQTQTEMRAPIPEQTRQQTQGTVRTTTRRNETTVNQGTPTGTTRAGETSVRKSTEKKSGEAAGSKTPKTETGRRTTTSAKKR